MNIIQQIIDLIMGLLGQKSDAPKQVAKAAEEPERASAAGALKGLEDVEGAENIHVAAGEVKIKRDGASLIEDEDDGELLWVSTVNQEVPRDSWEDVWGPLSGPDDDSLATFFMNETAFNMEMTSDAEGAEEKLKGFGYADAGEFFKVRATIIKHFGTPSGPNLDDAVLDSQQVMSAMMKGAQMGHRANMADSMAADPALTEPIEGVTIEGYAQIASQAAGKSQEEWAALLAEHDLNLAKWDAVQEGWTGRMQNDTSYTLTTLYGQAFQSAGTGQFGAQGAAHAATGYDGSAAAGEAPMTLDRCCEIQGAIQAWSETGQDVNAMLQTTFEMNAQDQAAAHSWWLSQLTADVSKFGEYNTLVEKYQKQYSAGAPAAPDADLDF